MSHTRTPTAVAARRKSQDWIVLLGVMLMAVLPAVAAAPAATTTTLTVKAGGDAVTSIAWGSAVTLIASVQAGNAPVTAGTVNFCDANASHCEDIHLLGQAQLTSAGTAALHLVPGIAIHNYQAVFIGTLRAATSASAISTLSVTGSANSSTTIQSSGSAGNYTLTGTLSGFGIAAPAGQILFQNQTHNNTVAASAPLDSATLASGFTTPQTFATGANPYSIAVGDFRGTGTLDLAVANRGDGNLSVILGNGDGTFSTARNYSTGNAPDAVAAGDFNNDGIPDLVVANSGDNSVTVLLGNGDGTFTTEPPIAAGSMPTAVAIGDFNNDGNLDLAVADSGSGFVSILLGNGNGSFQPAISAATGNSPHGVALADFNGDGRLDIVTANYGDGNVSVLLGNGDGSFQSAVPYSLATGSSHASGVAVGDFNGDGFPDIAVAGTNSVGVLINQGTGAFKAAASYPAGSGVNAISIGDFNLDGIADLTTSNVDSQDLSILFGSGDGTFGTPTNIKSGGAPQGTAVADFNGDGRPDLAAAVSGTANFASIFLGLQTVTGTVRGVSIAGKGAQQVVASSLGVASSYAESVSGPISLVGSGTSTSLAVTAIPTPAQFGQAPTIIATLTPLDATGITAGSFTAFLDTTVLLNVSSIGGNQFQIAGPVLSNLPLGAHTVAVNFEGSATYLPSGGSVTLQIIQATPTLKWTPPSTLTYGTGLTNVLTAAAVNGTTPVAGSYVYTATPTGGSPAAVTSLTLLLPGAYTINVAFTPSNATDFQSVSASAPLTVNAGKATVTLGVSPNPVFVGGSVTLTANVTGTGVAPTGSVEFIDGQSTILSTVPLTSGAATFTTSSIPAGGNSLTAVYTGDGNYQSTGSAATILNVEDFTLAAAFPYGSTTPPLVLPGGSLKVNLTVATTLGTAFPSALTLSASGLPASSTAVFTPASIAAGSNSVSAVLTINLGNQIVSNSPANPLGRRLALAFASGLFLLPFIRRKRWPKAGEGAKLAGVLLLLIAGICATLGLTACGGGGSGYFGQQPKNFTVNITAASGTLSHTSSVVFTVE